MKAFVILYTKCNPVFTWVVIFLFTAIKQYCINHYVCIIKPVSLSLYHYPCVTIPVSLSLYHYPCITIPVSLSLYHYPCITIPVSLSLFHYPCITIPLSSLHQLFLACELSDHRGGSWILGACSFLYWGLAVVVCDGDICPQFHECDPHVDLCTVVRLVQGSLPLGILDVNIDVSSCEKFQVVPHLESDCLV